jgi:hypothetical protein
MLFWSCKPKFGALSPTLSPAIEDEEDIRRTAIKDAVMIDLSCMI